MSVVDREALKEALEKRMLHQRHHVEVPHDELELFTAAARSVLEGEAIWRCDTHRAFDITAGFQDEPKCHKRYHGASAKCRMVRVVVVPIGGE